MKESCRETTLFYEQPILGWHSSLISAPGLGCSCTMPRTMATWAGASPPTRTPSTSRHQVMPSTTTARRRKGGRRLGLEPPGRAFQAGACV